MFHSWWRYLVQTWVSDVGFVCFSSGVGTSSSGQCSVATGIQTALLKLPTQLLHLDVSSNATSRLEQNSFEGTSRKKLEAVSPPCI